MFITQFLLQCVELSDSIKSTTSTLMSFNSAKKLKISKPDSNNTVFIFKTNKKIFKDILAFNKYMKTFKFGLDHFVV